MSTGALVEEVVGAILRATPAALDLIERLCSDERARRVEAIRPEPGHTHAEDAVAHLRGDGEPPVSER